MQAWDSGNAGIHSKPLSRLPKGGSQNPPQTQVALQWKVTTNINRQAPFPLGKGGGIGPQTDTPINRHNRGEVRFNLFITPPFGTPLQTIRLCRIINKWIS